MLQDITEIAKKCFVYFDNPEEIPNKKEREEWVALLIDADGFGMDIDQVLLEVSKLGRIVVRRLYGNFHVPRKYTAWRNLHHNHQFIRRISLGVHKNIADMALVADAVELATTVPDIGIFVIVSNDGGFFPLMYKLSGLNKKVFWVGGENPLKKADRLREEVDQKLFEVQSSLLRKIGGTNK